MGDKQLDKNTYMGINERGIERVILVIYTTYTIVMTAVSLLRGWGSWVPWVINIGMVLNLFMHLKKYRDYRFRAYFTATMAWMNFVIDGMYTENIQEILSTMVCMIILLSVYCIPEIVYVTFVASTFLFFYHGFILSTIHIEAAQDGIRTIFQIVAIYMAEYVSYYLIRTQVEGRQMLMETIEDLKRAEQSKDDFMANVSHEIRTPINTVCGISEMVLHEDLSESVRRDIFGIQTAGRNLLAVVSDVLDFSELQSGKMELIEEPYNITSTINDIMNMTIAKMGDKNLELIVDCDTRIPNSLLGDEQKIRRAVMNIVDNAIKFTNDGGILISVTTREEEYGVNLSITIQDTGIGMNEETIEKLFSSFNQVDTRRNRQEGGIGLGLAIAQALVSKMGGFITIRSTLNKGSEVQIVIPQKVQSNQSIVTVKNPKQIRIAGLINMDKYSYSLIREGYIKTIQRMAEQMGFYFRQCRNMAELKRRVEKEKYSHIFIGWEEYEQDPDYFEEVSNHLSVILIQERDQNHKVGNKILRIYKPFYALSVAAVLNGENLVQNMNGSHHQNQRFVAPEASVLVVDDNMMNLRVVEGLLRPYQIKVFVAESGKEALEKVDSMAFDMIFMDHMMPEMDGVETFQRIRQKPGRYFQNIPIIALTANAIGGAREMFLSEGFADFVAKPIELSVLERVLRKYIPENKIVHVENNIEAADESEDLPEKGDAANSATPSENPAIDMQLGISYCGGNIEDYVDVVRIYDSMGQKKCHTLEQAYGQKDWDTYRIETHALKSTSLGIGATHLSELAKNMEMAASEKKEDVIHTGHQLMMEEYRRILHMLETEPEFGMSGSQQEQEDAGAAQTDAEAVQEDAGVAQDGTEAVRKNASVAQTDAETVREAVSAAHEVSTEEMQELLNRLKESLESFEPEEVHQVMDTMQGYAYHGELIEQMMRGVHEKVEMFDFIGAEDELDEIQKRVG